MRGENSRDVCSWLLADIRRRTLRGPLNAQKQTLANRISEAARFRSAYRSKADVGDEIARRLLLTPSGRDGSPSKSIQVTRRDRSSLPRPMRAFTA